MKSISYILLIILFSPILLFTSCEKEKNNDLGQLQISIENSVLTKKNTAGSNIVKYAVISIESSDNEEVYQNETVEILQFGTNYISEPLDLQPGNYRLIKFMLLNDNMEVIYASPLSGSDKAYLVDKPLPIGFGIDSNEVTKVVPEVLSTENSEPSEFGYVAFDFNVVETFDFLIGVFRYNYELENLELVSSNIEVYGDDKLIYSDSLSNKTSKITLRSDYNSYKINIIKPNFKSYTKEFTREELQGHFTSPLMVILEELSNQVLSFDGVDDYLDLGAEIGTNVRTVELWFNLSENIDSTLSNFVGLIGRETGTYNYDEFNISFVPAGLLGAGTLRFGITEQYGKEYFVYSDRSNWNMDEWHHVAAVVSEEKGMMLFIDGIQQWSTNAYNQATSSSVSNTVAGSWGIGISGRFFKGKIDNLHISTEALYFEKFDPCVQIEREESTIGLWYFDREEESTAVNEVESANSKIFGAVKVKENICNK